MKRNETLLKELHKLLDDIKKHIESNKLNLVQAEIIALGSILNDSLKTSYRSVFFEKNDMVKSIMKIIHKIDKSISSVETEMHGVANYSHYEKVEVDAIAYIQTVKNQLNKMLDLILAARPEIRNEEMTQIINQLHKSK
jgi:methionine synthase II (cobalamin-independent)